MPLFLIANVVRANNKLVIGHKGNLLIKIKKDLQFFKRITTQTECKNEKRNIVVMGKGTWESLPQNTKPLKDRINIVITNDKRLHKQSPFYLWKYLLTGKLNKMVYFMTIDQFTNLYCFSKGDLTVFIIGGGKLYDTFLHGNDLRLRPDKIYFTETINYIFPKGESPVKRPDEYTSFAPPTSDYKPVYLSERQEQIDSKGVRLIYYYLMYSKRHLTQNTTDESYNILCNDVVSNGEERDDRTGVGTIGVFGKQVHYDISHTIPLLTTKSVPWKHVIEELLWFMRGDTDAKILQKRGVKIWDGNTSRTFLDSRGLTDYPEGILGAGYGWQWRFFGGNYNIDFADTSLISSDIRNILQNSSFDQLSYIESELRTNPSSRRIMMCYWNPPDFHKTALLPCHYSCQFYVRHDIKTDSKILDCHFTMRSNDLFLGHPFNIASYSILTHILALRTGMKPGKLVYTGADVHIYKNHLSQLQEQSLRVCRTSPYLWISPEVKTKNYENITIDDFCVVGYYPHPSISAPMAI